MRLRCMLCGFWDMQVAYVQEGLEAIIFTSDGDMRQGLNNLQATHCGFGLVDADAVFKVGAPCMSNPLPLNPSTPHVAGCRWSRPLWQGEWGVHKRV